MRNRRALPLLIVALIGFIACQDTPTRATVAANHRARLSAFNQALTTKIATQDDHLEEVAAQEPAFAGMFVENGQLIVMLTDLSRPVSAVRGAITSVFTDPRFTTIPIQTRQAKYGWSQLYAWGTVLPRAFSVPGVTVTDLDEVDNRISIGIANDAAKTPVLAMLARAGIPAEAIVFKTRKPVLMSTFSLHDEVRNIFGGLYIENDQLTAGCTLGFNAIYQGDTVFATNGHCSEFWGRSGDATGFYQDTTSQTWELIGAEGYEEPFFDSTSNPACPGHNCKYNDLELSVYNSATRPNQNLGFLYLPTTRTQFGNNNTVNTAGTWNATITNKELYPLVGDTVNKIGSTTGWTSGPVTATCENVQEFTAAGDTVYVLCQHEAAMGVYHGDSGSGVFKYYSAGDTATMDGQVWAGDSLVNAGSYLYFKYTYFSTINDIQAIFGTVIMTIYGWF